MSEAAEINAILGSVAESVRYFQSHEAPDLIFSDIQLGDGLSFDIFRNLKKQIPIIFCTAYDEFALEAFKAFGIDYVLKPFTDESIQSAINKYLMLKNASSTRPAELREVINKLEQRFRVRDSGSILVYQADKIIPIQMEDIAIFSLRNELIYIHLFNGKVFTIDNTLDELESQSGRQFYRANRQVLIHKKAVKEVSYYFARKLLIHSTMPHPEPIVVSKLKASDFLQWLRE